MAQTNPRSRITPHTEYARTHVRCRQCAEIVPTTAARDGRCARCASGGAP